MYSHKTQIGFTFIELMIAVVLGSLMTLAAFRCFSVAKQFIMRQNAEMRIQESRIMLHQWMAPMVHQSGSFHCAFLNENLMVDSEPGLRIEDCLGTKPLDVFEVKDLIKNSLISNTLIKRMKADSPILWMKHAEAPFLLGDSFESERGYLDVKGMPEWQEGDVLVLSDCSHLLLLRIKKMNQSKSENSTRVSFKPFVHHLFFSTRATIAKLNSTFYFIGNTQRKHGEQKFGSLYQYNLNTQRSEEIIEGLEAWDVSIRKENQLEVQAWFHSVEPAFAEDHAFINQGIQYQDRLMHQQASYSWRILGWV